MVDRGPTVRAKFKRSEGQKKKKKRKETVAGRKVHALERKDQ